MFELLKWFFGKMDFLKLAEAQRNRNNRRAAARLHIALVLSYDILELFEVLLDELDAALQSHRRTDDRHLFSLNLHRVSSLLLQQSNNLDKLDHLFRELYAEMRLVDPAFQNTYGELFSGKAAVLFDAQHLLTSGRLPIHEDHPLPWTDTDEHVYRTLWFSPASLPVDREHEAQYLHGFTGRAKQVVDVHVSDGDPFFAELERYFTMEQPRLRLEALRASADSYRQALERHLSLSDVLAEIGTITRYENWGRPRVRDEVNRGT